MDIYTFWITCIFMVALAVAVLAFCCIRAGIEYDKWAEEFNEQGIQWAPEPVLHGSEVVGYTQIGERRANRS